MAEHEIEGIVPCSEEAFYLATRYERLAKETDLFTGPFATLARLHATPTAGHGLHIVAAISRVRGVTPHSDGKTVWAAIGLDSAERPDW